MKNKRGLLVLVILIAAGLIWIKSNSMIKDSGGETNESKDESEYVDLKAGLQFTGTQFVIENKDTFDWQRVRIKINYGLIDDGYVFEHSVMTAGKTYQIGAVQFAKKDGTRFNPYQVKPQKIYIACDTPNGRGVASFSN